MRRSCRATLPVILAFGLGCQVFAGPVVFWSSDPVGPGETVLAVGAGFGDRPTVEVARLADGPVGGPPGEIPAYPGAADTADMFQAGDRSLKFLVPQTFKPGVFAYRIRGSGGAATGLLNRPVIWWAQGDLGTSASPGGSLRVFGKNLGWDGKGSSPKTAVVLQGPKEIVLPAEAGCYATTAALPRDLPVGEYQVFAHNGCGGSLAWSSPIRIRIENPRAWPQTIFDVKTFGSDGSGANDDTAAIRAALAAARKNGGGVVYFPRGRYRATGALAIPRFTVLRGEKREWASLFWPDLPKPPESLLQGVNSFGLEDLTLYCGNYRNFLSSDTQGKDAGDVFLRRLRVRADVYRGHMAPEEIDRRYREGLKTGFGGGYWLVVLGGRNLEVTDCDLYSSSCVISLTQPRGARIERNILGAGRWGGGGVFGGDGLILADNHYLGNDLMSWGAAGGLGFGNLSHVYIGGNTFALEHGGDREPITSDASGEVYHGRIASGDAAGITLPQPPKDTGPRWQGAAVYVVGGRGEGQWRKLARFAGRRIVVDRPWDVVPDASSTVAIVYLLHRWLILDNRFSDTGMAVQLYGAALEHIVAGNRSIRTAGYHNFGMNYYGVQPSWYVQWLGNEVLEGNIYNADHDNWRLSGDAHIGVYGLIGPEWRLPVTVGTVIRANRLHNNASIVLGTELGQSGLPAPAGRNDPLVKDTIVEGNLVEHSDVGVYLFQTAHSTLLRDNRFRNVKRPLWDEAVIVEADRQRRQKLSGSRRPIAQWKFGCAAADLSGAPARIPDSTGNGFDALASGLSLASEATGKHAGKFSGESFLRVDDAAVFNLESVTLGLWIKPDTVRGRQGLIGKRWAGTTAPFVLSLWDGRLEFEATDEKGEWSFNFRSPAVVNAGVWSHVAAVVEQGAGVTVYCNGEAVARHETGLRRLFNQEPLIAGREAWDGAPNGQLPCYYQGLMDEVTIWARALAPAEVRAEFAKDRR
jgi:hypothetical protein